MRILLLLLLMPLSFFAGQDNGHYGGRSAGMGHSSVMLSDVWSTHHNQAGLGWLKDPTAGIFFQNRYLLKELSYMGFAYAHPIKSGTFGLSFSNFGSSLYGESKIGLGYGMKFSDKITGGLQLNYHNTRIANNYGNHSGITAEIGMQAYLTDNFMLAVHLFNPTRSKLNEYNDERIPTVIRLGLSYEFSSKIMATMEAEKDLLNKPVFKAGLEYKTNDLIHLRVGVGTNPTIASFGFGINLDNLQIDVAASYHQTLGFSPELSLNYNFGKAKNKEKEKLP
jgi:hypothetical protein